MSGEIKDIMIDCPACEKETKITVRDIKLAIQHRKETGDLILVSCKECCRALVLPDDIPGDGAALEEWFVEATENPDDYCACIPMLDSDQEKIPAGGFDDLGVTKYRPGGGGPAMRKRPYMYAYGIDPACHMAKNPSMGGKPMKVGN
jgi:hypothetical protein